MVRVFGHDAAGDRTAVRRLLGDVPQQLSADSGPTGRENVSLFARVFGVPRRERAARVAQALGAVGLTDAADRLAGTCSGGGMVRRRELAQALVSAPRLLILDEPTIGLDPIARTGVRDHITAVREATGVTVLVTTHSMDEADRYCDRVALMHRGRVRALGTPLELRQGLGERRRSEGAPATAPLPTLEDVFRIARSAMFIAIFYGIQIIWERGAGVLNRLLVTPTPRAALIIGKAFAAGVKSVVRAVVVVVIAAASSLLGRPAR